MTSRAESFFPRMSWAILRALIKQISVSEAEEPSLEDSSESNGREISSEEPLREEATWGPTVAEMAAVAPKRRASRRVSLLVILHLVRSEEFCCRPILPRIPRRDFLM